MPAGEISLGLIGVGRWGRNIVRTISTIPGIKLVAAASRNPETALLVPPGCRLHANWREVVAANDLDGVIIATPAALHAEMVWEAIEANKAVMVEKPLVASRDQASWLCARIGERKSILLVDHVHLFHPAFQELRRQASALGPIRSIASAAGKMDGTLDVSLLWDWAPHDLAMCMALAPGRGLVTEARYLETRETGDRRGETVFFSLTLAGDVEAKVELSNLKPRHRWFAVAFDDCMLVYRDAAEGSLTRLPLGEDIQAAGTQLSFRKEPPLRAAIARFADAIRRADHDPKSFELGLSVVSIVADIEEHLAQFGQRASPVKAMDGKNKT